MNFKRSAIASQGTRQNSMVMMAARANDDQQGEVLCSPYTIMESVNSQVNYNLYLCEDIGHPSMYIDMIQLIQYASEDTTITIHINCTGGRVDTGIAIINAMRASNAHIVTEIIGVAQSMAALIFLSGHEFRVHSHTQLMFHNYSGGNVGKGNEMRASQQAIDTTFSSLSNDICRPFMSEEEVELMLDGKDYWFHYDDIVARLTEVQHKMQEEREEEAEVRMMVELNERARSLIEDLEDDLETLDEVTEKNLIRSLKSTIKFYRDQLIDVE